MLKLNLQYFGHLMSQLIGKVSDAQKNWRQEEKGLTEVQMVGWHHQLNGHEFEQALGDGDGQENLMCCRLCGRKELDMTEQLNNNKPKVNCDWLINSFIHFFIQHTCARSWDVKMNWNASALKVKDSSPLQLSGHIFKIPYRNLFCLICSIKWVPMRFLSNCIKPESCAETDVECAKIKRSHWTPLAITSFHTLICTQQRRKGK